MTENERVLIDSLVARMARPLRGLTLTKEMAARLEKSISFEVYKVTDCSQEAVDLTRSIINRGQGHE